MTTIKYVGYAMDKLGVLKQRQTRKYANDYEAHCAAERLCKKYLGERGYIRVDTIRILSA